MIKSVLIANRGEIAVRVIRSCQELGIRAVAVYSTADKESLHVKMADDAVCIGPAVSSASYLNQHNLISAAVLKGCDALHPGVGFLSENAGFARQVNDAGIIFIGPTPEVIEFLGDKIRAKTSAREAGIPVIPGSSGSVDDAEMAAKRAEEIGFPVMVKAASGGGGKGIRIVRSADELPDIIKIASHEAETAFSDKTLYMEKFIENPRHVEVQVIADTHGTVVHLGERDCSAQQNHQKLVEESPSPGVTPEMRKKMCDDAVRLFKELKYHGAGTIEFLVQGDEYYFMEVNARVQVEHPVTEMVTGVDIIREQIKVASGQPLSVSQKDVKLSGWAMECRINATSAGQIENYLPAGGLGVRVDSFMYPGYTVPHYYDSMVAKLIVHAATRNEVLKRMDRCLKEFVLEGISCNIDTQLKIINNPKFKSGKFDTSLLETILKE